MRFVQAEKKDKEEIRSLYRQAIGSEGCTWSEEYPTEEITDDDLAREALFCMKGENGRIIGAVSMDEDPEVDALPNWSFRKEDGIRAVELARLVIREEYRNQGFAGKMAACMLEILKEREYLYAYFLVSQSHERAIRAYKDLGFSDRGEAELFGGKWFCYEKNLTGFDAFHA